MRKDVLIAGIVGIAAVGLGAYALTRGNSNKKQSTTATVPVSGYGGGATGGYSEPTAADTVRNVLETVMSNNNITPLEELMPEMQGMMNPSDEAADIAQNSVPQDVQRVFARGGSSMVQQLTDMGYSLPMQSNSGAAATLGGQPSNAAAALVAAAPSRAVENEIEG